uniref:P53-induced death domain-containing protein 1 isoform X1 n=1 Tax=Geotrypetes seraphini TaxID=260995 RepID=A0A6P8P4I5_GEOSA|nr:p53-induced death domain-containing protein 1 isoform X1 [Geotrypetes seraphini]
MEEPLEMGGAQGEESLVAYDVNSHLADNRLNLDVYPDGCSKFLALFEGSREKLLHVEFLRLNCSEEHISAAVQVLPFLTSLRSLVLRGGITRDEAGACQRGILISLPLDFRNLTCLTHLDLSFNNFLALPDCITELVNLTMLSLCHNQLLGLPKGIGRLKKLTLLSVMANRLQDLPCSIGKLTALETFDASENALESIPVEIGKLRSCTELNLSGNQLTVIPDSLANLLSLRELHLHSNSLVAVPVGLANLPNLSKLDLQNNCLRFIPPEIQKCSFVQLRGNPLGQPQDLKPQQQGDSVCRELQCLYVAQEEDCFTVTSKGCRVFLSCGTCFCFPQGAVSSLVVIQYRRLAPDPQWVKLQHHDVLLSEILELKPHGIKFLQEVQLWMPYIPPRVFRRREVVIRTFSGQSWNDLSTKLELKGKHKQHLACCNVPHFSWFLVVSQLVEDQCNIPQEGGMLVSSVEPAIKVRFPPGVTEETRSVKMQVLPVDIEKLQEIAHDLDTRASPLLCLSQSSATQFLRPVKIQLPLPYGITGQSLERSRLHLLHGDPLAETWSDITDQVLLEVSHIYACFEVQHFSWYWLWYTTKQYVGGIAKKVYERLRMYQVNFLALQRKRDPEQVLLQCVPKHKVDSVLKRLYDRYQGPEPSDLVEMFEGEQFFAAFERGLDIDADRPDCVAGRISFIFYSHMKNQKEVYVTSDVNRKEQSVKGQVSFYRGAMPESIPEDVTRKRKGPDSHWLATLPIKLPKLKSAVGEHQNRKCQSFPPLNLGNAETGYLTEANLLSIARRIGIDWRSIGLNLGLSFQHLERISYNNKEDLDRQIQEMLFSWATQNIDNQDCVKKLITAMEESSRQDIADEIQTIIQLGKQKYSASIHRLGLDRKSSNEDSAMATG